MKRSPLHNVDPRNLRGYVRSNLTLGPLIIALGIAGLILCGAQAPELGLTLLSLAVVCALVSEVIRKDIILESLLPLAFLVGTASCWCIGLIGYTYILPLRGFSEQVVGRHTLTSASLAFCGIVATALGWRFVIKVYGRAGAQMLLSRLRLSEAKSYILPFALIYVVYQAISLRAVGLNARWEIGNNLQIGSAAYLVSGFHAVAAPLFAVIGICVRPKLNSTWNLISFISVAITVLVLGLTGGRETALEPVILFGFGLLFSDLMLREVLRLWALCLPIVVVLILGIGWVRDMEGFAGGSLKEKSQSAQFAVKMGRVDDSDYSDPYFTIFNRLFESSGQVVIDTVYDTGIHSRWLNFDRLPFVFVPMFIYPEKRQLNDGFERLVEYYGFTYSEFSSSPITLVADSYDRFGYLGVFAFHFIVGAVLTLLNRLLMRFTNPLFIAVLLVTFAKMALRLYPESVLGFTHAILYASIREVIILAVVFITAHQLKQFISPRISPELAARGFLRR